MRLDVERANESAQKLANEFGLRVDQLAEGIVRVANANMERAMRLVSVARGHDPRDFALLAFGGAGGMHACELADRLEIPTVIVPRYAGVLSALGMLLADVSKDFSASVLRPSGSFSLADLATRFQPLVDAAHAELEREGFDRRCRIIERLLDLRYVGQSYEITVPFSRSYRREFDRRHHQLYGYADPARSAEIVNLRVHASGITDKAPLPQKREQVVCLKPSGLGSAQFNGHIYSTAFYRWEDLTAGSRGRGPAVITSGEATTVVPPGFGFRVDSFGNLIIRKFNR
jgi:N-methylhydantoinase A/oxoprolinase/acetone carboxylase beta subunit